MKFCIKCGAQREEEQKFCTSCGDLLETGQDLPVLAASKKPGLLKAPFMIAISALILMAASIFAYPLLTKKSAKQQWFVAEARNYQTAVKNAQSGVEDLQELQKALITKASSGVVEIMGSFSMGADLGLDILEEVMRDSKIIFRRDYDPIAKKTRGDASFEFRGSNLISVELLSSSNQTGVRVPALESRYFYINNNEFGKAMRRFDPYYSGPEEFPDISTLNSNTPVVSEKTKKEVMDRYVTYLTSSIKDSYVSKAGDTYNGNKVTKLTVSIPEEEMKALLLGFVALLRSDEQLTGLLVDQLQGASVVLDPVAGELSAREIRNSYREAVDSLDESIRETSFPQGFHMTLLVDAKGVIVKRDILFAVRNRYDELAVRLTQEAKENSDKGVTKSWTFEASPDDFISDVLKVAWDHTGRPVTGGTMASGVVAFQFKDDWREEGFTLEYTRETMKGSKITDNMTFNLTATDWDVEKVSGLLKRTIDQDIKRNYAKQDIHFSLAVEFPDNYYSPQNMSMQYNVKSDIQFKNVSIPDIDRNSSLDLANVSDDELSSALESIMTNFEELFYQNFSFLFW